MNNKNQNGFYTKRENRIIYVLFSPDKKLFYINHCLKHSLKETYRHNFKGRRISTRHFIDFLKPSRPCLFVLEELPQTTIPEANNYLLVWLKILLENNYISFNNPKIIEQSKQLYFQNKRLYEERKYRNLQDIFSCENCMMPKYKNQICKRHNSET